MTPAEELQAKELQDSLESFARSCNANASLMGMIKDWNRTMHIRATDIGTDATLVTRDGVMTTATGAPASADLALQSTAEILAQVFYGEVSPNAPYNDGTLRIQGPEGDIVRLDFVTAMLWE